MRFVFDERKAAEAAALLLERHGGTMAYIKLIKLLYLADRQALIQTGRTITGDRMVSMDHGPVLSQVYDCHKSGLAEGGPWQEYISPPSNYDVTLLASPKLRALSPYEVELVENVFKQFGHLRKWDLVDYMHTLPEWENPHGSALPIDARVILREAGKSDEEIEHIAAEVEALHAFKALAAGRS